MAIAVGATYGYFNAREQGARRGRHFGDRDEIDACLLRLSGYLRPRGSLLRLKPDFCEHVVRNPACQRAVTQYPLIAGRHQCRAGSSDQPGCQNGNGDQYLNQAEANMSLAPRLPTAG